MKKIDRFQRNELFPCCWCHVPGIVDARLVSSVLHSLSDMRLHSPSTNTPFLGPLVIMYLLTLLFAPSQHNPVLPEVAACKHERRPRQFDSSATNTTRMSTMPRSQRRRRVETGVKRARSLVGCCARLHPTANDCMRRVFAHGRVTGWCCFRAASSAGVVPPPDSPDWLAPKQMSTRPGAYPVPPDGGRWARLSSTFFRV